MNEIYTVALGISLRIKSRCDSEASSEIIAKLIVKELKVRSLLVHMGPQLDHVLSQIIVVHT